MSLTSKIGLGTVQFGIPYGVSNVDGQTTKEEVDRILSLANKKEIKLIDTASAYGNAEEVLGGFDLSSFEVVSKFMPSKEQETLEDKFELSLQKLNLSSLYGYLAHRPLDVIENPNQWETLQKLKHEGKIRKIGFSLNTPSEIENLILKGFVPCLVQVPYNYLDNRFKDVLIDLKRNGCEIHTRSSYLQGLFFMNTLMLNSFFDEVKPIIKSLQDDCNELLSGALLKYVLDLPFIDKVIIGIENSNQLQSNLNNIEIASSLEERYFNISESILMPSNWPK
jgi:aryl-alcohol dehydrogenase-like predicted oxidoreductase